MGHCDIQSNLTARWVNSGFRYLLKQPDEGLELFDRRIGHDPIGDLFIAPAEGLIALFGMLGELRGQASRVRHFHHADLVLPFE